MGLILVGSSAFALGARVAVRRPSYAHSYRPEQALLPSIAIDGSRVHIDHVRTFRYGPDSSVEPGYAERVYDLDRIRRVWFGVSPFAGLWRGPAHTFVSFEFADSVFIGISVEARKETGEDYSPFAGALRNYELMYVIADEPDLVGLRAVTWRDPVYLYPGRASPEQVRRLFLAMLRRAQELEHRPEFYNSVTDNCTTNIARAINEVTPGRVGWNYALALPGYSDRLALRLGLLDTDLPLDSARAHFRVDERARAVTPADSAAFSTLIRPPTKVAASRAPAERLQ